MEDDTTQEEASEEVNLLFFCRCESAKSVSTLLSCLRQFASRVGSSSMSNPANGEGSQTLSSMVDHVTSTDGAGRKKGSAVLEKGRMQQATVYAHPGGLTFHVHGIARQSQASVDMQCGLFSEYSVSSEKLPTGAVDESGNPVYETIVGGEFCVNLPTMIESLHVLGLHNLERTKVCMSYNRSTAILKIELEDRGVLATAAICGSVPEFDYDDDDDEVDGSGIRIQGIATSSLAVAFRNHPVVARAIVKSDVLRSAIAELADIPGATCCTIGIAPDRIEIGTVGHSGECLVHLPKSSEVFASLECNPPTLHAQSYPLFSLLQGMRGLDIAHETCISINSHGMIAIQHQVLDAVGNSEANFIDFLMSAIQEEDDDGDEEEEEDESQRETQNEHENAVFTTHSSTQARRRRPVAAAAQSRNWNRRESYDSDNSETDDEEKGAATRYVDNKDLARSSLQMTSGRPRASASTKASSPDVNAKVDSDTEVTTSKRPHTRAPSRQRQEDSGKRKSIGSTGGVEQVNQPPQKDEDDDDRETTLDGSQSPELLFGGTRLLPEDSPGLGPGRSIFGRSSRGREYESETDDEEFN